MATSPSLRRTPRLQPQYGQPVARNSTERSCASDQAGLEQAAHAAKHDGEDLPGGEEEEAEVLPTKKRGGQAGKRRLMMKRPTLTAAQQVEIVRYVQSFRVQDRPTHGEIVQWA
eukprot:jgi/Tetstr1/464274/TSEL_009077.t1